MNEESKNSRIEPELEARIVALVLGEASDFERDELNRLIKLRPELASFKSRMQKVHGLLRDVAASEFVPQGEDWKLSSDRRNAVLAVIRGEATVQPAIQDLNQSTQQRVSGKPGLRWRLTKVAAVFCIAGFVGMKALQSFFSGERAGSGYFYQLAKTDAPHDEVTLSLGTSLSPAREPGIADADGELYVRSGSGEFDYQKHSVSALSAIQDTLSSYATLPSPDYLKDDVQHFPGGPEFKLPDAVAQHESKVLESQAYSAGEVGYPASAATPAPPTEDVPDGGKVLVGSIEAPSVSDVAPNTGEIITGNEELSDSGITRGTGSLNGALDFPDAPRSGEESNESLLAWQDFGSQTAGPEQQQAQEWFRERAGAGRESSKDRLVASDGGNQVDDFHMGSRFMLMDGFDIPGTTDGNGAEDKSLVNPSGRGGEYGNTAAGNEEFGGGVESDLNLPSREWSIEMPSAARGIVPGEMDGISSFDDSGLDKSSRSKVQDRSILGKPDAAEELSFKKILDSAAIASPSPEVQPATESAVAEKEWYSAVDGEDTELTKTKSDETVRVRAVAPQSGPTEVIRELDSTLAPAPIADTDKGRTPVDFSVYGGIDVPQFSDRLPSKQLEQKGETQRESGELANERSDGRFRYVRPTLDDNSYSMKRPESKAVAPSAGLNEKTAAEEAFSTFSLHVSDVSFKLALAALERGEWPEAAKIRIEEFVNAFDYGDPMPLKGEKVACRAEQSIHPFVQQRNLLRISMRTSAAGRSSNTPLRLTFLLDNSGSMERTDRQQTVRRAFDLLAQQLTPIDQVTLISFARQPRLLAEKVSGAESGPLVKLIDELPSEGGTNIEAALQLAFEKAREQQSSEAQNRIILLTDGAVNLGDADPENLSRMVSTMREAGIAFDAAGISAEGLNDEVLEALTRKGDGRYYLLDSLEAADDGFARQIAGALRPSAKNVKVQIEFNPKRVGSYKLLGFEKHILKQEDFHNDNVDAAEMGAAEAGVALYQFEAKPDGEGDVGSVSVRFRDLSTGQMIENRWPIPYEADAPRPDQAAPSLRIAASAALLAAKLRGEPLGETVDLQTLSRLISGLPDQDRRNTRVQQLQLMIEQARQLSGK